MSLSIVTALLEWIENNRTLFGWLGGASFVTFVVTLIAIPWLVARIPADYFIRLAKSDESFRTRHPVVAISTKLFKNAAGVVFLLAGIAMLVLPGQGILTILIGIMLIDFPGKRRFELALIRRPHVLRAVNWIRKRSRREPLQIHP